MLDLMGAYKDILERLPVDEETEMILTGESLGWPPPELETDGLVMLAHPDGHVYPPATRRDGIVCFADKPTYRALGLLTFASIFAQSRTVVHLRERRLASELSGNRVTRLIVDASRETATPYPGELVVVPSAFGYWPAPPDSRHPLHVPHSERYGLPTITLSNDDDLLYTEEHWKSRNVVSGFGDVHGAAAIACLFLNIGLPQSHRAEYDLEAAPGYKSVTDSSAELKCLVGYDYPF